MLSTLTLIWQLLQAPAATLIPTAIGADAIDGLQLLGPIVSRDGRIITPTQGTTIFVDEIDGQIARVVQGDRTYCLPTSSLPAGTREGMTLEIKITSPETYADDLRAQMVRDDDRGDIKL